MLAAAGAERTPNESRTDLERTPNGPFRTCAEPLTENLSRSKPYVPVVVIHIDRTKKIIESIESNPAVRWLRRVGDAEASSGGGFVRRCGAVASSGGAVSFANRWVDYRIARIDRTLSVSIVSIQGRHDKPAIAKV